MRIFKNKYDIDHLVVGVLDTSGQMDDPRLARKFRDLTISWSRYDYRGEIIESTSVDAILRQATGSGHRWCLVLPGGHVVAERWTTGHELTKNFFSALEDFINTGEFLVSGNLIGDDQQWFGFEKELLLINLDLYRDLATPAFEMACLEPVEVPQVEQQVQRGRITMLQPSGDSEIRRPELGGWNLIATSLRNGVAVRGLDDSLLRGILDLNARSSSRTRAFAGYLNKGVENYRPGQDKGELSEDQISFLNMIQPQTRGARNGVFLWNIEAYTDIETPAADFYSPLTSLYTVAAGFKPNRILSTHGFDRTTRVVFFDYSPNALEIRKYMVEHWDGTDFPGFVAHLFETFPHPETFYQLWDNKTPDNVDAADIIQMWQRELKRWGSAEIFRDQWQQYRELQHVYVCCDILTDPEPVFEQISCESNAIIWWSNAFFTMYGNWFFTLDERKKMYDGWIGNIARLNPDLFLYGSDYNNINVNSVRASDYFDAWQTSGGSWLKPCRLSKTVIRM